MIIEQHDHNPLVDIVSIAPDSGHDVYAYALHDVVQLVNTEPRVSIVP